MEYTFRDPKVINFLQNNPDLYLDQLLLALLPLIDIFNPDNDTIRISKIEGLLHNVNESIVNLQYNSTHQFDVLKSFINNNNHTLIQSLHSSDSSNFSQIIHSHTQSLNEKINIIQSNVVSFNNMLNNPSKKGSWSELKVESMLSTAFPNFHIKSTHHLPASGDFLLEHHVCGNILVENKEYNQNVPKTEIDKFVRDMQTQNCHGILMSQSSGIANKFHLQIDIVNHKLAVYLLHTHYNHSHLSDAVNVIQSLLSLGVFDNNEHNKHQISSSTLNDLHKEYIKFNENNKAILLNLQNNIKALKSNSLNSFESFLANKFNKPLLQSKDSHLHICHICNKSCKSLAGLKSHSAKCSQ
tara:strand:- start:1084 stop:2148 length:1065 start_codon:yes stop_codon:yes gene_type:complete